MAKKYIINGVQVDYETYSQAMNGNPDDFGNLSNIDASDIPQRHKDAYAHDRWNERMGRGKAFWTPRRRMLDAIARKEKQVDETRGNRLKQRQVKLDACGKQREYEGQRASRAHLIASSSADRAANQESEDKKSVVLFVGVFIVACLLLSVLVRATGW